MDIQKNKIINYLKKIGVEHELGGLIYAICELKIIRSSISNNNKINSSETRQLDVEYEELYATIKHRCSELKIDWTLIEDAISTFDNE